MQQMTPEDFLSGKPEQALLLFNHFISEYEAMGNISLYPTKTMLGVANGDHKMAWVTQFGKKFIHVVFPFRQPYPDNLCFTKIAQVPGNDKQFNHHFRMEQTDDINDEVKKFMKVAFDGENQ